MTIEEFENLVKPNFFRFYSKKLKFQIIRDFLVTNFIFQATQGFPGFPGLVTTLYYILLERYIGLTPKWGKGVKYL